MRKILVMEDEDNIRAFVVLNLKRVGYDVVDVASGEAALEAFAQAGGDFDIAILDIMLPGMDGLEILRRLREGRDTADVPVIMLTARSAEMDRVAGLENGADDYVVKPFSPRELMARVRAVLARSHAAQKNGADAPQQRLKFGGLEIDLAGREVYVDGVRASMTPKEYDLLFYLVKNKGLALSRDKLLEEVWGYDFFGDDRTVDTHIKMLRGSLGPYRTDIVTLRGMGYKFDPENDASSASPAR